MVNQIHSHLNSLCIHSIKISANLINQVLSDFNQTNSQRFQPKKNSQCTHPIKKKKSEKMRFSLIFIAFCAASFIIFSSEVRIEVKVDPEDLDDIGDFLFSLGIGNNIITTPIGVRKSRLVLKLFKKILYNLANLFGFACMLVSANLATSYLSQNYQKIDQIKEMEQIANKNVSVSQTVFHRNFTKNYGMMCHLDYGCYKNRCWRSCSSMNKGRQNWCYTEKIYC